MSSASPRLRIEPTHAPTASTVLSAAQPLPEPALPVPARPRSIVRAGLRWAASGTIVMVGAVVVLGSIEYLSPDPRFTPSHLIGTMSGRLAAAEAKAAQDAKASYVEGIKAGELKADLAYQKELAKVAVWQQNAIQTLQADLDRSTAAWQNAYQLTQVATQGAIAMESDLVRMRAATVAQNQGMKGAAANLLDFVGMLGALGGDRQFAQVNGDAMRSEMAAELTRGGMQDAGAMAARIMQQFPNPAQFRIEREEALRKAFTPVAQR